MTLCEIVQLYCRYLKKNKNLNIYTSVGSMPDDTRK